MDAGAAAAIARRSRGNGPQRRSTRSGCLPLDSGSPLPGERLTTIRTIRRYTRKQWGSAQASDYEEAIHIALETLRTYPEIGKARDDLRPNLRSHPVLSHIIVYRVDGETLNVLRIVHQRMDLLSTLLS